MTVSQASAPKFTANGGRIDSKPDIQVFDGRYSLKLDQGRTVRVLFGLRLHGGPDPEATDQVRFQVSGFEGSTPEDLLHDLAMCLKDQLSGHHSLMVPPGQNGRYAAECWLRKQVQDQLPAAMRDYLPVLTHHA